MKIAKEDELCLELQSFSPRSRKTSRMSKIYSWNDQDTHDCGKK